MLHPYFQLRNKLREWADRKVIETLCHEYKLRFSPPIDSGDTVVFKDIFLHKAYADYFPFYRKSTIVDVGAHKGFFTLFAALNTPSESRIFSLEPSRNNFEGLTRNLAANNLASRVSVFHGGLSDRSGTADLYLGAPENHSLFAAKDVDANKVSKKETVELMTLEDYLARFSIDQMDFLKMDCEGAEYQVLFSSRPETLKKITTISMEFHDLKTTAASGLSMIEFLKKNGFTIVKFQHETTYLNLHTGKLIATRL